jgi:hypothetical protein
MPAWWRSSGNTENGSSLFLRDEPGAPPGIIFLKNFEKKATSLRLWMDFEVEKRIQKHTRRHTGVTGP